MLKYTNNQLRFPILFFRFTVIRITRFIGSHVTGVPLWGAWSKRQKRNLEDIILTEETKIKLDNLISDFLKSGRWYSNRGLSWKKGFLLHGPPGCGKTSTIIGLASKYNLKIYYLSLNHPFLTDESLVEAIRQVHQRSIICLEVSFRLLPQSIHALLTRKTLTVNFFSPFRIAIYGQRLTTAGLQKKQRQQRHYPQQLQE